MQLVLASTSIYRQRLLTRLGLPFSQAAPAVDETPQAGESPKALAERLAQSKAAAVADQYPNALIIGSDQVAVLGNQLLGKPGNRANAIAQLTQSSGQAVTFLTGLCLLNTHTQESTTLVEPFTVHFRDLSQQQIERYVDRDQPFDCAGSFKWESLGISLFSKMDGEDVTSLEGLPLIKLVSLLNQQGLEIP